MILSKYFGILEYIFNHLGKLQNEVKHIINLEETDNSDYVMTCINIINSTSNTFNEVVIFDFLFIVIFRLNIGIM